VRLIDEEGKQLGILPTAEAIERALARSLDLVEVAPDGDPPVCRILDYTKFRYDQKRKQKAARKKTTKVDIKEIKLRPNIDPHDFSIKLQHAREFVEKGNKLKVTVRYRRGEMRHYEIGTQKMDKMIEELKDLALVESTSRGQEGLRMQTVTLSPRKTSGSA
jgi:translation initiation factor IF-3